MYSTDEEVPCGAGATETCNWMCRFGCQRFKDQDEWLQKLRVLLDVWLGLQHWQLKGVELCPKWINDIHTVIPTRDAMMIVIMTMIKVVEGPTLNWTGIPQYRRSRKDSRQAKAESRFVQAGKKTYIVCQIPIMCVLQRFPHNHPKVESIALHYLLSSPKL